jgi:TrmH family RNA methyltransferase
MQEKRLKKFKKVVYLDKIGDPGNMGTIIRTALAFDYDAVIVSEGCVDVYNEKVVAASKGAIFLLPVIKANLKDLKEDSTVVVSALTNNSIEPNEVKIDKRLVLVIGSESHGVSPETLSLADYVTKIKISNIDSLNASIAAGILMFELGKQL